MARALTRKPERHQSEHDNGHGSGIVEGRRAAWQFAVPGVVPGVSVAALWGEPVDKDFSDRVDETPTQHCDRYSKGHKGRHTRVSLGHPHRLVWLKRRTSAHAANRSRTS